MYEGKTTWNPLAGKCGHECSYCSTNSLRTRYKACADKYNGEYRLIEKEMNKNLGKGKEIFVCAQNDLFEINVPDDYIRKILEVCRKYPENTYLFQSKNPARFLDFYKEFPVKSWLGTTIETDVFDGKISKAPVAKTRAQYLGKIRDYQTYVTIEPIMKFNPVAMAAILHISLPNKVYIGADSKKNNLPEPTEEEVLNLIELIKDFCPNIELKSNLRRIAPSLFERGSWGWEKLKERQI